MPEQWIRLLCSASVILANETVIARIKSIKLLTLGVPEIFGSSIQFPGGSKCPFPPSHEHKGWQTLKQRTSYNYFHLLSNFNTVVGRKWRHFNNRFWSKWLKTSDGDAQLRTKACKLFWPTYQMLLRDIFNLRRTNRLFSVNLNHDVMVGINYKINLITYYYLSCAYPQHGGDERVITRKCN